jgi:nitrogen regulatory protein PII
MLTVMLYGVITEKMGIKGEHELEEIHIQELRHAIEDANDMRLSTVNVHGTDKRHSYKMAFSAVHIVVPQAKEDEALMAARDAGARGVTIMNAHGMGLEEMDNFYNRLHSDATDSNLMFIVPTKKVDAIIRDLMNKLDITAGGEGIAYSYPISHLKGLTLKSDDL